MNLIWLMRAAKWVRRPPSMTQVRILFSVLALAAAIWGLDHFGLWPDWARIDPKEARRTMRP